MWFVSYVVWSLNMVVKSCEKIVRQSFGQMIESEFDFIAICEGSIGTIIIFHNTFLIMLCSNMFFTLEGCWLSLSDRFYDFFFIFFVLIYPLVIRVDKKKELKLWPQLSQDWPIHHFNHMILFHFFVDFGGDRVESIEYLIKWKKWMMTLKPLANKDHWENWKIKSIHPTSILGLLLFMFDDQLIGWYFLYF